jgi:hypothetical protein
MAYGKKTPPPGVPILPSVTEDDLTPPGAHVDDPVQARFNERVWRRIEVENRERVQHVAGVAEELGDRLHKLKNDVTKLREEAAGHYKDDESRFEAGEKEVAALREDVDDLRSWQRDVDRLHAVTFGHEPTKDPGRLGRIETRQNTQEGIVSNQAKVLERLDRILWKIIVAATVGGAVAGFGVSLIKSLL